MDINQTVTIAVTIVMIGIIVGYVIVRPQRTKERIAALEKGIGSDLYFSSKLLKYIPWQFWTSVAILVLLLAALFISKLNGMDAAAQSFMELVKYVTGAVFGSMFGKGSDK